MALDPEALAANWAHVASHGGHEVAKRFYAYLFITHPEVRPLFPLNMDAQRDRLVNALGNQIVANVADPEAMVPYLKQLGRDHRKFGAFAEHYPAVGNALIFTLRHYTGPDWTPELEAQWVEAYNLVSSVMIDAAEEAAKTEPAHWDGKITNVARPTPTRDLAVITVEASEPIPYRAGQSLPIECDRRPRLWRWYSPANRPGGSTLEFHVSMVPGAGLSSALVHSAEAGDRVKIGPPFGENLTPPADNSHPLLLLAGGTGWAPLKALVQDLAARRNPPRTHLIWGVRDTHQLYDHQALAELERANPWLTTTITVSRADATWTGTRGHVPDVAMRDDWTRHDVYVCGPPAMVSATVDALADGGVPADRIHHDTQS